MKKIILFFVGLLFSGVIYSQSEINGKITEVKTGKPLVGVNIYIPEKSTGTVSDKDGYFSLQCMERGRLKLEFSLIGYEKHVQTVMLENDTVSLDISLSPAIVHTQEVVVSAGVISTQHENAVKVEVIDSEKLLNSSGLSLAGKLQSIPGMDMISKGGGVTKPVLRGLSQNNLLMLNNGVKMENFQFSENHPFLVNEFGVEKIEVIKGPASLLYGSDALAGVINVLKEKPAPAGVIKGDFHQQYHTVSNGFVSNLGVKGSTRDFFWGVRGSYKDHADYRDGNDNYVPNSRFNEYNISLMSGLVKKHGTFKVYYDYIRPRLGMSVNPAVSKIQERDRTNNIWYQNLDYHLLSSKNVIFLGKSKLEANVAWQFNKRRLFTDSTTPSFKMVDMELTVINWDVKWHIPTNTLDEWIVGLQGMDKENRNQDAPNHVIPDADVATLGGYIFGSKQIAEGLKAQSGLRYDWQVINTQKETQADTVVLKPSINRYYRSISGSAGVTWTMMEELHLRLNFASGYRVPTIAELTENGMHGARFEKGNSALNPMRNYETDVSIHWHSEKAMIELAGFYNPVNQFIYLQKTGSLTSGVPVYEYRQDDALLYGGELLSSFKFGEIQMTASYAHVTGVMDNGNYLPFIPQDKYTGVIKYEKLFSKGVFEKLNAQVKYVFADKQNRPGQFEQSTDSYQLLNLRLGTTIGIGSQKVNFGISASNLLNETYLDHLSTLRDVDETLLSADQGRYNPGRNFMLFLNIPFQIKQTN